MDKGSSFSLDLWILIIYILDITNGGFQSSTDDFATTMNATGTGLHSTTSTTTTTLIPITKIITFTSTTASYEILPDETNNSDLTPATIINEPYFDTQTPKNVTGLVGKSAYLSCRVRSLGNKTVSWIRHRDIHILTVGSYTYTSDQRFQATYHKENDEWTLQIKWAQKRDGGVYECQISTQPVRSYFVNLNVVVPTASILGGPDLHFDKGSTINLTCTIKYSPEPPAYIFWYHHDEVISYDSQRGGVSVITEKGDITTSYLLIQNADLADAGRYSCSPSNADVASVRVHVLNVRALISGEHPEAMQTGSCGKSRSYHIVVCFVLLTIVYNYFRKVLFLQSSSSSLLGVPSLLPSCGLSPAKFLINFKLEPKEGVCTKFQRISTHTKS